MSGVIQLLKNAITPGGVLAGRQGLYAKTDGKLYTQTDEGAETPLTTGEDVTAAIAAHEGLADPHPGYLTPAEGNAAYEPMNANIQAHIASSANPHTVTKSQVGLGNCDNTSDANKPVSTATQTALDGKVAANGAITGGTKTKITYDAKGLVTAGADATTADIADSLNKRYVTDAHLTLLGNTSGTNSGNETTTSEGALINGATAKATPVDADQIGLMDSAASNVLKKLSWANLKATAKTYFDGLYLALAGGTMTGNLALKTFTETGTTSVGNITGATNLPWNGGSVYKATLTGNVTFTFTGTPVAGQSMTLILTQDATGSRTITWPTMKWAGGSAPSTSSTGGKIDIIGIFYDGVDYYGFPGGIGF